MRAQSGGVWKDKMKFRLLTLLIMMLHVNRAHADEVQADLAFQIRQASTTQHRYLGDETHSYLDIIECEVSAERTQKTSHNTLIYGYRFDLSRTRLPEVQSSETMVGFGVLDLGDEGLVGTILFEFISPYRVEPYGDVPSFWPWGSITGLEFSMPNLTDTSRPLRVLTLLQEYQSQFCSTPG